MSDAIDSSSLAWMPKSVWGPIKWKELHTRALMPLPMDNEPEWFEEFIKGVPCPKCRGHFDAFRKDNPPDFNSREKFFAWTVCAHNHVNHKTGKPSISEKYARALHEFIHDE